MHENLKLFSIALCNHFECHKSVFFFILLPILYSFKILKLKKTLSHTFSKSNFDKYHELFFTTLVQLSAEAKEVNLSLGDDD